jgi:exosome complex component RRP45
VLSSPAASDSPQTRPERMQAAVRHNCRIDGRGTFDARPVVFDFAPDDSGVLLSLGETRVLCCIEATLDEPRGSSTEGRLVFDVDFSPMASAAFESVRP